MTSWADLVLENLQIGETYNLTTLKNCPMVIKNSENETLDINITIDPPSKQELKEGYETIPDINWIKIVPNKFRVGPMESASADVIITIPQDEKLVGRHFQAQINAASTPLGVTGNFIIATGTRTRIRLSVGGMGPESLMREKKVKKMKSLDFEFDPTSNRVAEPIKLGKKINLKKDAQIKLNLINKATDSLTLNISAVTDKTILGNTEDYEVGNPEFIEIKPKKIKIEGESIEKLTLFVNIPNKQEYRNKKYVFLIKAEVIDVIPIEIYSKLYITTEK